MGISWTWCGVLLYLPLFLIHFPCLAKSLPRSNYLTANPSISWTNSLSDPNSDDCLGGSTVRNILVSGLSSGPFSPAFACGFYCKRPCDNYLFAIFILCYDDIDGIAEDPQVVWSANQNHPVSIGATLKLTSKGGLVLKDANGTTAWLTNITTKPVAGLNFTEMGNLVLLDENNATIWQSFDHPTDSLIPGQKLVAGQKITSIASPTDQTEGGLSYSYLLSVTSEGLFAFIESNPPQVYFRFLSDNNGTVGYMEYLNQSLALFTPQGELIASLHPLIIPQALVQYMRPGPDGHLRVYQWEQEMSRWNEVADLLTYLTGDSGYPLVCGNCGICTNGQCICPPTSTDGTSYFKQMNDRQPDRGCSLITPLSCEASQNHTFLELNDVSYFAFEEDLNITDSESCKQSCLNNCSCKAAIFRDFFTYGHCYLPSQLFSLMTGTPFDFTGAFTTYVKVLVDVVSPVKKTNRVAAILWSSLASLLGLFLLIGVLVLLFWKKKDADEAEEHYLDQLPGMPKRFSYDDLKAATENFNKKLGGGGFGSVFEGTLIDGTKVAVKRLDGFGQIKKSFSTEVETIGSVHHFNLVRLIGFCAEKSHRLLVYEYMSNGSLDKWIFQKTNTFTLDWLQRKKIIVDTAKGLAYLHEDCRQKIIHFDVKPGNILLDENFNAKVSNFGLSKLIDRDQSQVVTIMRGTPGYLAPEWLSSVITEKVYVYSFGVMTLEIVCGRRIFDHSQPEEAMHLLNLFKIKAEQEELLDLVDKQIEEIQLHREEILTTMKVAAWCLQCEFPKRPSMSVVVKVLEGIMDVEDNLDYNFFNRPLLNTCARVAIHQEVNLAGSTPLSPSVLSGPRYSRDLLHDQ